MTTISAPAANAPLQPANVLVGANVRRELKAERYSERLAARTLDWGTVYLNRRVRGEVPFSPADLLAVARLLHIPVERLLVGLEAVPAETRRSRPEQDSNLQPTDYKSALRPRKSGRPPTRSDSRKPRGR